MQTQIQERPTKQTPTTAAAAALRVPETTLGVVTRHLNQVEFRALGAVLADLVAREPDRLLAGANGRRLPGRSLVPGRDGDLLVLDSALVHVPAGLVGDDELVLRVHGEEWTFLVEAIAPVADTSQLLPAFQAWVEHTIGAGSPFRGGQFQVVGAQNGMVLDRWYAGTTTRADLVVPDEVWQVVDRHVHGALELADVLAAEGLAASSGLLCVGPPGTGKSQLARIVASELDGRVTVLVPQAACARRYLRPLLRLAARLSPTLVILDDLDLVVGSRHGGDADVLQEFLTSMDETMATSEGVVVMASTNAPRSIDPAAVRATRFDAVLEMGPPTVAARERVLRRHLSRFPDLDFARLAGITDGATGADLRDLARRAYLDTRGEVTTADVVAACARGKWQEALTAGQYL
jgi:hypothetical protein